MAPSASRPPITYTLVPTTAVAKSVRGAGSAGPTAHSPNVALPYLLWNTVDEAAVPSVPPMYRTLVPTWTAAPPVRGAGRAICAGDGSHGSDRSDRHGARLEAVLGRTEVDRRPGEHAQFEVRLTTT